MGTTASVQQQPALKRHRIIERPRLLALLDGSNARVRTLVAPAGYGKTTLAEQWVGQEGRRSAWFTARRSSTDVAALSLGLARASTDIVPECDSRLREHLRALPAPAENVDVLAEILGEDLAAWPTDAWLVLDDYQELAAADDAERFVAALVDTSPIQLLVASRQRPSWATARKILYGEILELGQTTLAMSADEAADVLAERSGASASGLAALANGWPAVIGLAGVSTAEIDKREQVPESLYQFFAEEVFAALGADVQAGLVALAVAPVLDRSLAERLLDPEHVNAICDAAFDVGILVERGARLELHPLARTFLEERGEQFGLTPNPTSVKSCLDHYRARREWDAAFDLISRHGLRDELPHLLLDALDDLLGSARLPTIEAWSAFARDAEVDAPVFSLARAEVAFRHGRYAEAQAFAETAAAAGDPEITHRALSVGGRAAHLATHADEALEFFCRAEVAAVSDAERRDALWGQLMCAIELERPDSALALQTLREGIRPSNQREVVRAAMLTLSHQFRFGPLDLGEADRVAEVLPALSDPLVESSFRNVYANTLVLASRYEEALEVATKLLDTVRRYRLDFAKPHAHCSLATAHSGMRKWHQALRDLEEAHASARANGSALAEQTWFCVAMRVLAQQGKPQVALGIRLPDVRSASLSTREDIACSRALVLASAGRVVEAQALVESHGSTQGVEPVVLRAAATAICAVKARDDNTMSHVGNLEQLAFSTGAVDLLITAYRAAPELLSVLLRYSSDRERLRGLIRQAHDEDLARAAGYSVQVETTRGLAYLGESAKFTGCSVKASRIVRLRSFSSSASRPSRFMSTTSTTSSVRALAQPLRCRPCSSARITPRPQSTKQASAMTRRCSEQIPRSRGASRAGSPRQRRRG